MAGLSKCEDRTWVGFGEWSWRLEETFGGVEGERENNGFVLLVLLNEWMLLRNLCT